jgi:predicted permease
VLIAGQVAMSLVLLVGAQLMLATVRQLRNVDPGFRTDGVLTVGVSLYDRTETRTAATFYRDVATAVAALPGVTSVGVTNSLPIERGAMNGSSFSIESRPRADEALPPVAYYAAVTPGYFESLSIPLREGRAPEWRDAEASPRVLWVNETFAQQFLDGRALGERIRFGSDTVWSEFVGIVGDERHSGLREVLQPMAFHPVGVPANAMNIATGTIVLKTSGDPSALGTGVRSIVQRVNAAVPIVNVRTMNEVIARSIAQTSFMMVLLTIAAVVALVLGVVGLYGVISYVVGQRTNEIGVRLALGARPGQVRAMILRQGLFVALAGIGVGLGAAIGLTRVMESLLFEVSARDPWIFAGSAVALMIVSTAAADLPARRAASVEPRAALNSE